MGKCWKQLKYEDRLYIHAWLKDKIPVAKIAERLGVSRQTVYRELRRGETKKRNSDWTESEVYDPYVGERHYQDGLKVRGRELKIGNDLEYLKFLEEQICDQEKSPEAALSEVKRQRKTFRTSLCVNTIYSYIKKGIFLNVTKENLVIRAKMGKKKEKVVRTQKRVQAGKSITARPKEVKYRNEFGHWEMDTVVGPKGKSKNVLLVLTERKTRYELVRKLPDKSSASVVQALDRMERDLSEKIFRMLFKTITIDNGTEFSDAEGIERSRRNKKPRTHAYYCHPYASYERGTNENNNRFVRRKVPKGVNFDDKSKKEIQEIEDWINDYPRRQFGFETARERFDRELTLLLGESRRVSVI